MTAGTPLSDFSADTYVLHSRYEPALSSPSQLLYLFSSRQIDAVREVVAVTENLMRACMYSNL